MCFLPKGTNRDRVNRVVSALVDYFSLEEYGIVWNDGERTIPEIWMLHPQRRFTYFALLSLYDFASNFTKDKFVLDFGCGVGFGSYHLAAKQAKFVDAIDVDDKSIRYATDRYKHERLCFHKMSIEEFAADSKKHNTYDFIYCSNVMEHIADYKGALRCIMTLLKPGGSYLQITPPSGKPRDNPWHVTNFTVPEWRSILEPYFPSQRYFALIPQREREDTNCEHDFKFQECGPKDMGKLGSIGGIILALKGVSKTHSDREYYAPPAGFQLDRYIAEGNKQGVHHTLRYVWAIEAIKEMSRISRILDYGCGEGYGANAIAQAFPEIKVVALDNDPEAIAVATNKYRRPNLHFMTGDTRQYHAALGDSTFDLAVSFDVLEHVEHRELYFTNLTRYLRPAGVFFLSTPCGGRRPVRANPGWKAHKIEYNVRALYDVLRRYFAQVLRIDDLSADFPARHVFERLQGGTVIYLNLLNPVICRGPIKIEDPYAEYLQGVEPSVAIDSERK